MVVVLTRQEPIKKQKFNPLVTSGYGFYYPFFVSGQLFVTITLANVC